MLCEKCSVSFVIKETKVKQEDDILHKCVCVFSCVLLFATPMDCSPPGSSVHGNSPGMNTGLGCQALLQGIFPTQRSNPGFLHCRQILYWLSLEGRWQYTALMYSFTNLKPVFVPFLVPATVLTVVSWPEYSFLRRQVRWSGIPISFRIFHSSLWSTQSKTLVYSKKEK